MAEVKKTKPAYAVLIANAHSELIRKHRDGYTSSSLYFHLVKQYPSITRKGLANALNKMAANGQAEHSGIRWKVGASARRSLAKGKAKKRNVISAYTRYCAAKRAEIVAANPGASFGEVAKALGTAWKQLSDDQKAAYAQAPAAPPVAPAKAKGRAAVPDPAAPAKAKGRAAIPAAAPAAVAKAKGRGAPAKAKGRAAPARKEVDPRAKNAVIANEPEVPHKWQYEDNGWKDYDRAASQTLEAHWAEFQADPHSFDVRSVHSGSFDYLADFKSMQQTNIVHEAHTVRAIRRIAC